MKLPLREKSLAAPKAVLLASGGGLVVAGVVHTLTGGDVLSGAVSGLLAGGLARALLRSRSLAQNLRCLARSAHALAGGDLGRRADPHPSAPLGDIAAALNSMADQIAVSGPGGATSTHHSATLQEYVAFVERIGRWDLSARLEDGSSGEIGVLGRSLNEMADRIATVADEITGAIASLAGAGGKILAMSSQQAAAAAEQSAAVIETATTVTQMKATSEHSARLAREIAGMSRDTDELAQKGKSAVFETVAGMNDIWSKMEAITISILGLAEQTREVGDITTSVDDLAGQSHLLALNASIEAARAGDRGKGFAVVAGEMKNLAARSKAATAQVREILEQIQESVERGVTTTEEGGEGVATGVGRVSHAGQVIAELAETVHKASQASHQIAASVEQQSIGVEEIAKAMTSMSDAAQHTAETSQVTRTTAEEINALVDRLHRMAASYGDREAVRN